MTLAKVLPAILLIGATAAVNADRIGRERDWTLDDYPVAGSPGVCVASTTKREQRATYRLEIQRTKSRSSATEILIREQEYAYGMSGFIAKPETVTAQLAFAKMEETAEARFFWLVPSQTNALLNGLARGVTLRVYARNPSREVKFDFSARGFDKILQLMSQRCLNGGDATNADFESEFLAGLVADREPTSYDLAKVQRLRGLFFSGAAVYDQKRTNTEAIANLRAQYRSVLEEYEPLTAQVDRLLGTEIPQVQRAQVENAAEKTRLDRDLASVTLAIPRLQSALLEAQRVYDAAYRTIEPLLADHASLSQDVDSADQTLGRWQDRLATIRTSIASKQGSIRSLESELGRLNQEIRGNERELGRAEQILREQERNLNAFDPRRETERRLRQSSQYESLRSELQRVRGQVPEVRQRYQQARQAAEAAELALRECQRTEGADCSSQQAAANSAIGEMNNAQAAMQAVENEANRIESSIRNVENQIEREVDAEYQDLRRRYDRALSRYNEISSEISRDEARARDIELIQIPRLERDIADLEREEPSVEAEIASAQSNLRARQAALASFEQRTGWRAKKQALDRAEADRDQKDQALDQAIANKAAYERELVNNATEKDRLARLLVEKQALLARSQARVAELDRQLVPYKAEKARLDAVGAGIQASLNREKASFQQALQ